MGIAAREIAPIATALLAGFFVFFLYAEPAAAAIPDGFEDGFVTSVEAPTALAFTPDGRMLVTSKAGQVRVYKDGALLETPALDIGSRTCSNSERGLLGVAVDPDFGTAGNDYVYLYYTYKKFGGCPYSGPNTPVNRVSRFVMSGDTLDPKSEEVLVDNILSPHGNHNAGDVKFGKDGYLYVSVGDGGCYYANKVKCQYQNNASRERHVLLGKILRIDRDGGIPPDNPYTGAGSARCNVTGRTSPGNHCRETFAMGLRNPFRMAFDPDAADTSFRINDVGGQKWEEIDEGKAGADYGWNVCEGNHDNPYRKGSPPCDEAPYTAPIHEYSHGTGCESITGGAFVPNGVWPAEYDDAYLFGDFVCGKIFRLTPKSGGGFEQMDFVTGLGSRSAVAMAFGPHASDQALYYTTFDNGGEVRRISYTAGNRAPVAVAETVGDNYGPLTMNFSGSKSSDPDGNEPLTYEWDFTSDGTVDDTGVTASYTYPSAGKYTVTLKVWDSQGKESAPDTVEVFPGDTPPEPEIEAPTADALFKVGQEITLQGSATDAEDDNDGRPETASTLEWEVLQHHDGNHAHPYFSGTGDGLAFTAPAPEGLFSTDPAGNHLEIRLTATDSQGLSKTVVRELRPKTVEVGFETQPRNFFKLTVNGETFRAPKTFVSWEGYALNVSAPRQRYGGRTWAFSSWSDGGAREHTVTTPADPATYTATFKRLRR